MISNKWEADTSTIVPNLGFVIRDEDGNHVAAVSSASSASWRTNEEDAAYHANAERRALALLFAASGDLLDFAIMAVQELGKGSGTHRRDGLIRDGKNLIRRAFGIDRDDDAQAAWDKVDDMQAIIDELQAKIDSMEGGNE